MGSSATTILTVACMEASDSMGVKDQMSTDDDDDDEASSGKPRPTPTPTRYAWPLDDDPLVTPPTIVANIRRILHRAANM